MNGFGKRKNIGTFTYVVSIVFSILFIALCAFLFFKFGSGKTIFANATDKNTNSQVQSGTVLKDGNEEMRGVWIASVLNINFPSKSGLSEKNLKAEIEDIVKTVKDAGFNSIFFQVRPSADALYNSDIFPKSKYLSENQEMFKKGDFDCLEYMIKCASKENIQVHAWINPYRITMYETDEEKICEDSPANIYKEYTVKYADNKTYFNPGEPKVRELVVEGVKEICEKYEGLSGIHFDDYFYPYPKDNAEFDDDDTYKKYGGNLSKEDWRRENVNALIKETYETVKSINKDLQFGVSVFGIWANSDNETAYVKGSNTSGLEGYSDLYCDALSWAKGGYVDYIAPQNYWSFDTKTSAFDDVARWWNANLDGSSTKLYMGHAAYKAKDFEEGEIYAQIEFSRTLLTYEGSIFYGYEQIKNNDNNVLDDIKELYKDKVYYSESKTDDTQFSVNYPAENSYAENKNAYIIGSSDLSSPLEFEGEKVSRTKDGHFTVNTTLEKGENALLFVQDGKQYVYNVNFNNKPKAPANAYKTMTAFEIGTVSPEKDTWLEVGQTLHLTCAAPSGSIVTATIGGMTVNLSPTINPPETSEFMYELYKGEVVPSTFVKEGEIKALGTLVFKAQKDGKIAEKKAGLISQIGKNAFAVAEVTKHYSYTKIDPESSYYDDYLPSSKGMRDYVEELKDGYYKLRFGGYIAKENVAITFGKTLLDNKILTTAMEVVAKDTTNNDNNATYLRFGCTENVPIDAYFENDKLKVIFFNTDTSLIPAFNVTANPLVKSVTGKKGSQANTVEYYIEFKNINNFYGFDILYDGGMIIVKLNNPQRLSNNAQKPLEGKVIVVDAGHGGIDCGAPGPGRVPEATLNFNIANELVAKLRSLGAEVLTTRDSDKLVSLEERMYFLDEVCPDMAISVHHNSIASGYAAKTRGYLGLWCGDGGRLLASVVSNTVCQKLNREQKPTAYQQLAVARNHRFPSTLCEMCFISNVEEYQWSITPGNYEKSAQALVDGILEYYRVQEAYLVY